MTDARKIELFDSVCQMVFEEYDGCDNDILLGAFMYSGFMLEEAKEICGIE